MDCKELSTDYYEVGKNYWENVPATVDGMLGGHSDVLHADIQASSRFISSFLQNHHLPIKEELALDCGSGIGRITKHLLLKHFKKVDMVEQNKSFLDASHSYLGEDSSRINRRFHSGLQNFVPGENIYDVIWIQWVIGYLTDKDLTAFFKRCKRGLKENGIIIVKDNISSEETDIDHIDGSVTRPHQNLLDLFSKAELDLLCERKQYKFPKGLYEVKMFALR